LVETEESNPFLEIHVFFLDLFDEAGKEAFHLLLERKKFGDFSVGILADDIFELRPEHLVAFLVEEGALTVGDKSVFTDKGWLAALRVDADHVTAVAVDAFRAVLDRLAHSILFQYKKNI
jgi:hypothetical protein